MKKILFLLLMLFISNSIFAGYGINTRNKCRTFAKKYAVNVRTFSGYPAFAHDGDCTQAYAQLIKYCVFQKASNGVNGSWQQGSVSQQFCSRGETLSAFENFFLPSSKNLTGNIEESELKTDAINFNEETHSVEISGITGTIKLQKENGYLSKMRFSIWKPNDDVVNGVEDTTMEQTEVLHQLEIKVTDNGVSFNGNLVNTDLTDQISITDNGKEITVTFTDLKIDVPIDPSISLDDLAVMLDGDGAPDTEANVAKTSNKTDLSISKKDVIFNVYPNPTSDYLTIDFSNELSDGITSILIYNSNGEKIEDVFNNKTVKKEKNFVKLNVSNYPKGNYFILIESNGEKLTKQFLKK